ncbi:hypothetical protein [Peribacillus sp. ACCC06369]|uniref:hypothetical protein n=1 Tax=Peribacillus sp. ACCC06369 TaxID=3055860 RepID=UPI0025A0949B|nr:hypothetical protein [Peribacillus sp. ACCC06369]
MIVAIEILKVVGNLAEKAIFGPHIKLGKPSKIKAWFPIWVLVDRERLLYYILFVGAVPRKII